METNKQKTTETSNSRPKEAGNGTKSKESSIPRKIKAFVKENRKRLIWLAILAVVTWFILEIISNWTAFLQGFNDGMNQSR